MPLHTIKDSVTGKTMVISNDSPNPLSDSDIETIFNKQDAAKEKIATDERAAQQNQPWDQKFASSPIGTGLSEALKPFDWHPYEGAKDVYSGVKNAIGGDPIGGATTALGGIGKIVTPPALATAAVAAPALTAAGLGLSKLSEKYPLHIPGQETVSPSAQKVGNLGEALGNVVMAGAPHVQELSPPPVQQAPPIVQPPEVPSPPPPPSNLFEMPKVQAPPTGDLNLDQTPHSSNLLEMPQVQAPQPINDLKLPPPEINNRFEMKTSENVPTVLSPAQEPTPNDLRSEGIITPQTDNILNVPQESQNKIIQPNEITGTKVEQSKVPLTGDIPENKEAIQVPAKPDTTPSNSLENIISDKYKHLSSDVLELLAKSNINDTTKQAIQTELDSRNAAPTAPKTEQPITEQPKGTADNPEVITPKSFEEENANDTKISAENDAARKQNPYYNPPIDVKAEAPKIEQPQTNKIPQVNSPEATTPNVTKPEETGMYSNYKQALGDMLPEHDVKMGKIAAYKGALAKVSVEDIAMDLVEAGIKNSDIARNMAEAAHRNVKRQGGFIRYNDPTKVEDTTTKEEERPTQVGVSPILGKFQKTANELRRGSVPAAKEAADIIVNGDDKGTTWRNTTLQEGTDRVFKGLNSQELKDLDKGMQAKETNSYDPSKYSPKVQKAIENLGSVYEKIEQHIDDTQTKEGTGVTPSGKLMGHQSNYTPWIEKELSYDPEALKSWKGTKELLLGDQSKIGKLWDNLHSGEIPIKSPKEIADSKQEYNDALDSVIGKGTARDAVKYAVKAGIDNTQLREDLSNQGLGELRIDDLLKNYDKQKNNMAADRVYDSSIGNPNSRFTKNRPEEFTKEMETDPRKKFLSYVEGIKKATFDKFAVLHAREALAKLPKNGTPEMEMVKSRTADMIREFSGFNNAPEEAQAVGTFTGPIRTAANNMFIKGNSNIPFLHVVTKGPNLWYKMPGTSFYRGVAEFAKHPLESIQAAKLRGMGPGTYTPRELRAAYHVTGKVGAYLDDMGYYFNAADTSLDAIGWEGYKDHFEKQGMSPEEADAKAIDLTKTQTFKNSAARLAPVFYKDFGGDLAKPSVMWMHTGTDVAVTYLNHIKDIITKEQPELTEQSRLAMTAKLATATLMGYKGLEHASKKVTNFGSGAYGMVQNIMKGKFDDAAINFLVTLSSFASPAAPMARRVYKALSPDKGGSGMPKVNIPEMPSMPTVNTP